jgi:hypothetical protein
LLTVTLGKLNVGVAVTVGDNSIVGVNVRVGSDVAVCVVVDVNVGSGVAVDSSVGAAGGTVEVGCWVEGAQAETNSKINPMILYTFIKRS